MLGSKQKTLLNPINFEGVGLHSGLIAKVKLIPARDNQGIIFKRVDLNKNNIIKANYKNVSSAKLCTTLKNSFGASVSTVEHLMAAFYFTGIDNVIVEINSQEIPIMDGSAKDFVELIKKSGLRVLDSERKFLKIIKKVELIKEEKNISIEPNHGSLEVDFQLGYNNKLIGNQKNYKDFTDKNLEDIYSSRTFCLFEDIEEIKKIGLAKGGSLDNAVVVKNDEVLNDGGLRNNKEFVNHKILDLAGDFLLSGYRVLGNIKCVQGGHHLTNIFLKAVFKNSENFVETTLNKVDLPKKEFPDSVNKIAVNA